MAPCRVFYCLSITPVYSRSKYLCTSTDVLYAFSPWRREGKKKSGKDERENEEQEEEKRAMLNVILLLHTNRKMNNNNNTGDVKASASEGMGVVRVIHEGKRNKRNEKIYSKQN